MYISDEQIASVMTTRDFVESLRRGVSALWPRENGQSAAERRGFARGRGRSFSSW